MMYRRATVDALSDTHAQIFFSPQGHKVYIAYRGRGYTLASGPDDLNDEASCAEADAAVSRAVTPWVPSYHRSHLSGVVSPIEEARLVWIALEQLQRPGTDNASCLLFHT